MSLYHRTMGHLIAIVDAIAATLKGQPIPEGEGDNIVQDILRSNAFREWVRQFAAARVEGWIQSHMVEFEQAVRTLPISGDKLERLVAEGDLRGYRGPQNTIWFLRSNILTLEQTRSSWDKDYYQDFHADNADDLGRPALQDRPFHHPSDGR